MRLSVYIGILFFSSFIVLMACSDEEPDQLLPTGNKELIRAADVSFLPTIRKEGTVFYNAQQQAEDALDILKNAGCNTIRLRLWHTPSSVMSSLAEVQNFTKEIRTKGFKLWLTVHYSDTWADPGAQTKPLAWQQSPFPVLADSVYTYTKRVMQLLNPDYIQIGNEINAGMLWPDGSLSNTNNFIALLKRGTAAVREVNSTTKIMIHHAGTEADAFYSILKTQQVDYDIIALSYYPRWHSKNLTEVSSSVERLGEANNKDIVFAETAYPFTLEWNDWTNNLVGETGQLLTTYPATPEGQRKFLLTIRSMMELAPRGIGFAYWAPEWVAYRGAEANDGSSWENMALFDFNRQALPGLEVFKE